MPSIVRYRGGSRRLARYAPYARSAWNMGKTLARYVRSYRGSSGGGSSGNSNSAKAKAVGSLSEQKDVTSLYRRRRAPRRVRRRARRAMKMFTYHMDKLQSMKTCIITDSRSATYTPTGLSDGQVVHGITMYGYNTNTYAANTDTGNGDMWWIFARENGGDPTAALGSRKLRFRSCCINYTVQNTGEYGIYLDLYFVIARKNNGSTSDPGIEWNESVALQAPGNMPNAITSHSYYQITPFDAPNFGRFWLVKSRRRVFMQPNEIYSFQQRDAGNYVLNMSDLLNFKSKNNLTEGVIMVFSNPTVDNTVPGAPVPQPVSYNYTATKTYHYTEVTSSVDSIGV